MVEVGWGDVRPSDRAGPPAAGAPRRVGLVSVHTSPLAQPGSGDSGGLNVYVDAVARRLARDGVDVEVFTRTAGRDLPPTVHVEPGLAVHHLDAGLPTARKEELASHLCAFYLGLARHPATAGLDLLHCHYWLSGWVGRQARQRLGLPLVATFHTLGAAKNAALAPGDRPEPPLRLAAETRIALAADAVIAPTPAEAEHLHAAGGVPAERLHVVPPGVDLETFRPGDRLQARRALGGGRIVLFVGRLQPLKGPDTAIRTLAALDALLPADGLPTRLLVVGGASGNGHGVSDPARLRALAAELGVADRVAFLAPRPPAELAPLYRAADVVVVPSHSESFGLVALEAQACGTPVVASAVGGLRYSVSPPAGTLVEDHDPAAYARALLPYLADERTRAAAGAAGVAHAAALTWDATAGATLQVYRRVLAAEPAATVARGA